MVLNFADLKPQADDYAIRFVDRLLCMALAARASDVHLNQAQKRIAVRWRVDGSLVDLGTFDDGAATSILGRLKAMAGLITYRHDVPQEGRLRIHQAAGQPGESASSPVEARLGTLPTLHGERAVIRLAIGQSVNWLPDQLGFPLTTLERLKEQLNSASGVIVITGPAGSGKTTTAYAALRHILQTPQPRCIVTLEDPVESEIEGITQSQINPSVGFDWSAGLKALLRQDPEVMMVSEIRDPETAKVVFQAAMTGQLVITTMHARCCADALRRLMDMSVPAHHLRSNLSLLLCQRLLPKNCQCKLQGEIDICPTCLGTGHSGRLLIAELLPIIEGELARGLVQDADSLTLQAMAESSGMQSLRLVADAAFRSGFVSEDSVLRNI